MITEAERPLSVKETAQALNVTEGVILREIRSGKLPAFKVGREWRIHPNAIRQRIGVSANSSEGVNQ